MPLVILKMPFMRHYAGSLFDLNESLSWDKDQYRYERITPQRNYLLPDSGRGYSVDLSFSDTILCPPSVLEGEDLTSGPCRITSAKAIDLDNKWGENQVILSENKEGINITDLFQAARLAIFDRKNKDVIQEKTISSPSVFLDFSTLLPGFYEIRIFCKNDILYTITFIKCFPLVVTIDPKTGKYTTMKTIW
jgi:hypothetical protein